MTTTQQSSSKMEVDEEEEELNPFASSGPSREIMNSLLNTPSFDQEIEKSKMKNSQNNNKQNMDVDNNNQSKDDEKNDESESREDSTDYSAISILIDELMKDDPSVRIRAIKSLSDIAIALGDARTREELIPYLTQIIDDDDEILLVLIDELYNLLLKNLIGKSAYYYPSLIPIFERLCQVEEKLIRDEAINKFKKILIQIPLEQFNDYTYPLLHRLCNNEWHTSRISGVTLLGSVFPEVSLVYNKVYSDTSVSHKSYDDKVGMVKIKDVKNDNDINMLNTESSFKNSPEIIKKLHSVLSERDEDDFKCLNENFVSEITGRRSSINLLEYKRKLYDLLVLCCNDSIPIVRRSSMVTLGHIVSILDNSKGIENEITKYYIPLFNKLCRDEQDNVKVFGIETLLSFRGKYDLDNNKLLLYDKIRDLCMDSSWRVRYISSSHFLELCNMLPKDIIESSMLEIFLNLLDDSEAEVRAISINNIVGFSKLIGNNNSIKYIIPKIKNKLINDSNKYVRASLANIIIPYCYILPSEIVTNELLNIILNILRDEFPNVRLHIIANICKEPNETEEEDENKENKEDKFDVSQLLTALIPSIVELTLDKNWRVRLGIIEKFPLLAKQFGEKYFNDKMFKLILGALQDSVAEIRLSAAKQLYEISKLYNEIDTKENNNNNNDNTPFKWARNILLPKLKNSMQTHRHYLHRITILSVYEHLSKLFGIYNNTELLIEIAHSMENDTVANIRFKSCQILESLANIKSPNYLISIKHIELLLPKLNLLLERDDDLDVKYFSQQAINSLKKSLKRQKRKNKELQKENKEKQLQN